MIGLFLYLYFFQTMSKMITSKGLYLTFIILNFVVKKGKHRGFFLSNLTFEFSNQLKAEAVSVNLRVSRKSVI